MCNEGLVINFFVKIKREQNMPRIKNGYIINKIVTNQTEIILSDIFLSALSGFIEYSSTKKQNTEIIAKLKTPKRFQNLLLKFYLTSDVSLSSKDKKHLYNFVEGFYDYWRSLDRFLVLDSVRPSELVSVSVAGNQIFLSMYRQIAKHLLSSEYLVYRELPAFVNASLSIEKKTIQLFNKNYSISFVDRLLFRPPFTLKSASNKRGKDFTIDNTDIIIPTDEDTICYPIYVGEYIAYCFVKLDDIKMLVGLSNLFEKVSLDDLVNKAPNVIFVYSCVGYDKKIKIVNSNLVIGYLDNVPNNDYFGNIKKLLLTLHNILCIKRGLLPCHGAGFEIILKDGSSKNVLIIGDSGTGKSETINAMLSHIDKIINVNIIFDDMGVLIDHKGVRMHGTEIGAFIRLDDLDRGYAFLELDRAIICNPEKSNSRMIIPVSHYEYISAEHKLDYILYANNYELKDGIREIKTLEEVYNVFSRGRRFAIGTTIESGLSDTFFANPFGPVQLQKETKVLIDEYFKKIFQNGTFVGEIYTKLGIPNMERLGPSISALSLIDLLSNNK